MVQEKLVSSEKTKNDNNVYHDEPALRFPEFNDSWKRIKIHEITDSITKGTTPKNYSEEGINFIKVENIENNQIININSYIDVNTHKNELSRSILEKNDLLFSIAGTLGRTAKVTEDILPANTNQALAILKINDLNAINVDYVQTRLNCSDIEKYIFQNLAVGAQPNLNLKQVGDIEIKLPSKSEQDKIQNFINSINKKIELLEKKLVLCRKTIDSNLRKIYSDLEEYDEIKLKDIVKSYASNLSINKLEKNIGEYPLYGAEGIIKYVDFYEMKSPYISIIKDGAGVGRLNLCNEFSSALGTLQCLSPNEDININFLYFYLKTLNFNKYIVGSTIPHIYFKDYSKERIKVPSLRRQQDIGNYFSLCEKKNNLIKEEIEVLNKFKQGLLQKMFF